jgi:PleD family two-component response regulator
MGLSLLAPTAVAEVAPRIEPAVTSEAPPAPLDSAAVVGPAAEAADPSAVPLDPATGLVTREHAEKLLSELTSADARESPFTAALVEVAPIDWSGSQPNEVIEKRLLRGVSNVVRQSLAADHTLARFNEQQLLLLLPHEDVQQVTRRAEELRQRVATTEFVADSQTYQTTVTCALAEVAGERVGPRLFEFLQEGLDEAKRYGGNRTFMHDGKSPTPVVPAELSVAAQQLAI